MRHDAEERHAGDAEDGVSQVVMIGMPSDESVDEERAAEGEPDKRHRAQHRDDPAEEVVFAAFRQPRQLAVVQDRGRLRRAKHREQQRYGERERDDRYDHREDLPHNVILETARQGEDSNPRHRKAKYKLWRFAAHAVGPVFLVSLILVRREPPRHVDRSDRQQQ